MNYSIWLHGVQQPVQTAPNYPAAKEACTKAIADGASLVAIWCCANLFFYAGDTKWTTLYRGAR